MDMVDPQCLSYLKADPPHRVEVAHRILWHVTDPAAPMARSCRRVAGGEVEAIELDAACSDAAAGRKQPENRCGGGRLPRPRFADDRHGLSRADFEVDAAHRRIVAEANLQAGHGKQWRAGRTHTRHARDVGSRASRNTSPMIMNASTVTASAPAG